MKWQVKIPAVCTPYSQIGVLDKTQEVEDTITIVVEAEDHEQALEWVSLVLIGLSKRFNTPTEIKNNGTA